MNSWDMLDLLKRRVSPRRYSHTLGVAVTALRLAGRYAIDADKAYIAAILHDCAKGMPARDMLSAIRDSGITVDAEELAIESVLHAPAGALVAARDYGVNDPEILSAIRRHSLGHKRMSGLETLIYVSDYREPERPPFDGLFEARELAETSLFKAARFIAGKSVEYELKRSNAPHKNTIEMLNDMEGYYDRTTL